MKTYRITGCAPGASVTLYRPPERGAVQEQAEGLSYAQTEATFEAMVVQMQRGQRDAAIEALRSAFDEVRLMVA